MADEKLTYRVKEIIALTGLSKSTIYRLLDSGELPSFIFRGLRLVLRTDLEAWLEKIAGRD
jgi:excisionase family DNA binding protein